jgi:predicted metal-dependent enzyme (double-stranded beta helix superfamily)
MDPSGVTGHPDPVAATAAAEAVAAEAGLPVIEWGVAAPVAAALAAELGVRLHPFGGPGAWPAELAVDRDRHRQAIACHVSQEPGNPLLRRRLDLQGDRELVRFRPAPYRSRLARFLGQAGPLAVPGATAEQRSRLLRLLTAFAAGGSWPAGALDDDPGRGYGVHCLHEDPAGWTLASIVTGGRRATPPHDHSSWGAAATVTGVERNTRYRGTCPGPLQQTGEQVAPPGGGYLVAAGEIHQAADATGYRTVSVHLLAAPGPHPRQHCPES